MYVVTKFEERCLATGGLAGPAHGKFRRAVRETLARVLGERDQIISQHAETVATVVCLMTAKVVGMKKDAFVGGISPFVRCKNLKISSVKKSKCYSQIKGILA